MKKHLTVDLDSTLADTRHRKGIIEKFVNAGEPIDWSVYAAACLDDPPTAVVDLIKAYQSIGGTWHVVSGRSEGAREPTEAWLHKHGLDPHHVFLEDDTAKHNRLGHTLWKVGRVLEVAEQYPVYAHIDDWVEVADYLNAHTNVKGITVVPPGATPMFPDNPLLKTAV